MAIIEHHIAIVMAHSDTQRKLGITQDCIEALRKIGMDTILSSNHSGDLKIAESSRLSVFDWENPILTQDNYAKLNVTHNTWYENNDIRFDITPDRIHDFAVYRLMRNGWGLALGLGYEFIHFINYDTLITSDFQFAFVDKVHNYDILHAPWDGDENKKYIPTYCFSVKTKRLTAFFRNNINLDQYFQNGKDGWQIERKLRIFADTHQLKVGIANYPLDCVNLESSGCKSKNVKAILYGADDQNRMAMMVWNGPRKTLVDVSYASNMTSVTLMPDEQRIIEIGVFMPNEIIVIRHMGKVVLKINVGSNVEQFRQRGHITRKSNNSQSNISEHIHQAYEIGMSQIKEEIEPFAVWLAASKPINIMEIGTDRGGLFYLLCHISDLNGKKISLDLPHAVFGRDDFDEIKRNSILMKCPGKIHMLRMDSRSKEADIAVTKILDNDKLDVLFIDGDHTKDGVQSDWNTYSKFVKDGGIIAFHDIVASDFHKEKGCNVHDIWAGIMGEKREFVFGQYWGGIGAVTIHRTPIPNIQVFFMNGASCQSDCDGKVEFINKDTSTTIHSSSVKHGQEAKTPQTYFVNWTTRFTSNLGQVTECDLDLLGKKVYVHLDSKSLGDTIAWFPYADLFHKKHKCEIVCSTFHNYLFEGVYPKIEFTEPGSVVHNLVAMYEIGIFKEPNRNPTQTNSIPLQKVASDILGLPFQEVAPKIYIHQQFQPVSLPGKYICIGTESTAKAKLWNRRSGWQFVVNAIKSYGFDVVHLGHHPSDLQGTIDVIERPINEIVHWLLNGVAFIGLSSGLSWLSWALGRNVVMVSGVTEPWNEFTSSNWRISYPRNQCGGCYNDPKHKFDPSDWNWCPRKKNFECTSLISERTVIDAVKDALALSSK